MQKLITYFIKNPRAVNVIIIAFIFFGIFGVFRLNSSFFPLIESKNIFVNITYPGASPLEIEEGIVLKVENNLKGLKGIERVTSVSRENSGTVTIEVVDEKIIDEVLYNVKNAVDRIPSLPTGLEPIVVTKQESFNDNIRFAISGDDVSLKTLKQISLQIENELLAINGISQVEREGFPDEEIEIAMREKDLKAYNLSFSDISDAIRRTSLITTGGTIKTSKEEYLIRAKNRAYYALELENIILRTLANGSLIRLRDVSTIQDRFSETPSTTYVNGNLSVTVDVKSTNTEDLLKSSKKVEAYIQQFNASNKNIRLDILRNRSVTLKQRTDLLLENVILGIILVLLFLSLFLNTRLAFWVAFGLPISFLGMFVFLSEFDITINVMSLFGMIVVIGILVDDGIVIAENIYQHYEKGKTPKQAAIDGVIEVIPAVVSAIVTTIIAFSTFLFLDGRLGDFYSEVTIIVILTLIISLFEALVILPVHLAHSNALKKQKRINHNKTAIGYFFAKMRNINSLGDKIMLFLKNKLYSPTINFSLNNRIFVLSLFLFISIITVGFIKGGIIKATFFPRIASDRISINLNMPKGTSVQITDSIIRNIEKKALLVNDEYTAKQTSNKKVFQTVERRIGPGASTARLLINLLPGEDRGFSSFEITNSLRKRVGDVYSAESLTFNSGGNFGGSPISVSLLSNDIKSLKAVKKELKEILKNNPLLKDITDNDPLGIKEIRVSLKKNAFVMGFTLSDVMNQVRAGFFGLQVQRFQRGQDEIKIWIRYDEQGRSAINEIENMRIVSSIGTRVPFSEIATYKIEHGELVINHLNGLREIRVSADLASPSASAPVILAKLKSKELPAILSKYPLVQISFEGQNRTASRLKRSFNKILPAIFFLIYIVIAFTFKSYAQPLILLFLVPFSLIGVVWGHWLHGLPLSILSILGIVALVGIMVNDGLVYIGKFNSYRNQGIPVNEALYEAGRSRFRAIFLTSLTTFAGLSPLLLEKSRQAQFLKPMAMSISYGILFATLLTLLLLPLFISIKHSVVSWFKSFINKI